MDEEQKNNGYSVSFGQVFIDSFDNFPLKDKEKIKDFVFHVENQGFLGLSGRNKASHNVPKDDPQFLTKVKYAKDHSLWHYHIGIPVYDKSKGFGDYTSEYVLHYRLLDNKIVIVDMDSHPPLGLPAEKYLQEV